MHAEFKDRHVVVTGGTGALGSALVDRLLRAGAHVHVPCFHLREITSFPHIDHPRVRIESGIDLRSDASAEAFYASVPAPLWASIHVAGAFAMSPVHETHSQRFIDLMQANALTAFICCREACARMDKAAGGRLVNVSARPALEPRLGAGMVAYTTAKAAVAAMTQALASELKDRGILVNAVAPSIIDTPANRAAMPGADHSSWPSSAMVADAILHLASPANVLISGAIAPIYGRA
jgi:NAD(P)-dependent dehydrogenase (short-subunit alcohol dehydrogenase family)